MRVPLLSLSYLRADLGGGAILGPLQALLPPQPNSGFSVAFCHGLPCGLLPWPFPSYLLHCLLYDFLLLLMLGAGPLCMSALLVQRKGSSPPAAWSCGGCDFLMAS